MRRDLSKTMTFAALHFVVGFTVSYAFTGSLAIAGGIALVEPMVNTVVFYFHERAWRRAGRSEEPLPAPTPVSMLALHPARGA